MEGNRERSKQQTQSEMADENVQHNMEKDFITWQERQLVNGDWMSL